MKQKGTRSVDLSIARSSLTGRFADNTIIKHLYILINKIISIDNISVFYFETEMSVS